MRLIGKQKEPRGIEWKPLILCLVIPLAVGGLSALLSHRGMAAFAALRQPPLSPPQWLFPVVWTILYAMMGFASYLVVVSGAPRRILRAALAAYALQLAANFCWTLLFFLFGRLFAAFLWLIFLWLLIAATIALFLRVRKGAGYWLIPYFAWVTFAGYLNWGVWMLNS